MAEPSVESTKLRKAYQGALALLKRDASQDVPVPVKNLQVLVQACQDGPELPGVQASVQVLQSRLQGETSEAPSPRADLRNVMQHVGKVLSQRLDTLKRTESYEKEKLDIGDASPGSSTQPAKSAAIVAKQPEVAEPSPQTTASEGKSDNTSTAVSMPTSQTAPAAKQPDVAEPSSEASPVKEATPVNAEAAAPIAAEVPAEAVPTEAAAAQSEPMATEEPQSEKADEEMLEALPPALQTLLEAARAEEAVLKDRLAQLTPSAEAAWRLRGAEAEGERAAMGAIARLRASLKVQQLKGEAEKGLQAEMVTSLQAAAARLRAAEPEVRFDSEGQRLAAPARKEVWAAAEELLRSFVEEARHAHAAQTAELETWKAKVAESAEALQEAKLQHEASQEPKEAALAMVFQQTVPVTCEHLTAAIAALRKEHCELRASQVVVTKGLTKLRLLTDSLEAWASRRRAKPAVGLFGQCDAARRSLEKREAMPPEVQELADEETRLRSVISLYLRQSGAAQLQAALRLHSLPWETSEDSVVRDEPRTPDLKLWKLPCHDIQALQEEIAALRRHIEQEEQRAQRLEEGFANVGLDDGDGNEEDQDMAPPPAPGPVALPFTAEKSGADVPEQHAEAAWKAACKAVASAYGKQKEAAAVSTRKAQQALELQRLELQQRLMAQELEAIRAKCLPASAPPQGLANEGLKEAKMLRTDLSKVSSLPSHLRSAALKLVSSAEAAKLSSIIQCQWWQKEAQRLCQCYKDALADRDKAAEALLTWNGRHLQASSQRRRRVDLEQTLEDLGQQIAEDAKALADFDRAHHELEDQVKAGAKELMETQQRRTVLTSKCKQAAEVTSQFNKAQKDLQLIQKKCEDLKSELVTMAQDQDSGKEARRKEIEDLQEKKQKSEEEASKTQADEKEFSETQAAERERLKAEFEALESSATAKAKADASRVLELQASCQELEARLKAKSGEQVAQQDDWSKEQKKLQQGVKNRQKWLDENRAKLQEKLKLRAVENGTDDALLDTSEVKEAADATGSEAAASPQDKAEPGLDEVEEAAEGGKEKEALAVAEGAADLAEGMNQDEAATPRDTAVAEAGASIEAEAVEASDADVAEAGADMETTEPIEEEMEVEAEAEESLNEEAAEGPESMRALEAPDIAAEAGDVTGAEAVASSGAPSPGMAVDLNDAPAAIESSPGGAAVSLAEPSPGSMPDNNDAVAISAGEASPGCMAQENDAVAASAEDPSFSGIRQDNHDAVAAAAAEPSSGSMPVDNNDAAAASAAEPSPGGVPLDNNDAAAASAAEPSPGGVPLDNNDGALASAAELSPGGVPLDNNDAAAASAAEPSPGGVPLDNNDAAAASAAEPSPGGVPLVNSDAAAACAAEPSPGGVPVDSISADRDVALPLGEAQVSPSGSVPVQCKDEGRAAGAQDAAVAVTAEPTSEAAEPKSLWRAEQGAAKAAAREVANSSGSPIDEALPDFDPTPRAASPIDEALPDFGEMAEEEEVSAKATKIANDAWRSSKWLAWQRGKRRKLQGSRPAKRRATQAQAVRGEMAG